jgi:hypothetical protein
MAHSAFAEEGLSDKYINESQTTPGAMVERPQDAYWDILDMVGARFASLAATFCD